VAETDLLKRNLLALSCSDPKLSARLSAAKPDESISFIAAKSAHLIPAQKDGQRLVPFHSRFDPIREGQRYLKTSGKAGFLVVLGLGGGYHLKPFLEAGHISGILVIEKNIGMVRAVFENIDMRAVLLDPKVKILVDANLYDIGQTLLTLYLPTLSGNLKTLSLQTRVNLEPKYFQSVLRVISSSIDQIADDYTVQSRFGTRWFINTLANLEMAEKTTQVLAPVRRVIITGAGPSLEQQIDTLRASVKGAFLIATDTSLPCLLAYEIRPDLVLTIDCQQIGYHHFLSGYPSETPLVLDLASPPVLTRLTDKLFFFSSGHPFSRYLSRAWRSFPMIDTSGGNVSHAALSLAARLGAEEIQLLGIDFSYPEGKLYARETYLYPYFRSKENRIATLENCFFSFLLEGPGIIKEKASSSIRYTTELLLRYKERMELAIRNTDARVTAEEGQGLPLTIKQDRLPKKSIKGFGSLLSQGAKSGSWKDCLASLVDKIRSLPEPEAPLSVYWQSLSAGERELWMIQVPAATAFKEKRFQTDLPAAQLLGSTRDWTVKMLETYIRAR
jgi:hypothetical protein